MYILGGDRTDDVVLAFRRYRKYLMSVGDRFPEAAFEIATSTWWYDPKDHLCPHDAWLRSVSIREDGSGDRGEERRVSIQSELLGAYHDKVLTLTYVDVVRYSLDGYDLDRSGGHYNWRYDEFRLGDDHRVVHEIEWASVLDHGRWLIECRDVKFSSYPLARPTEASESP